MQIEPSYIEYFRAINKLIDTLTEKQKAKYDKMSGFWSEVLPKITNRKTLSNDIKNIELIKEKCNDNYFTELHTFKDNFSGKLNAIVCWFDKMSGQGTVKITGKNNQTVKATIFACNISGKKTLFPETASVYYSEGQKIQVELSFYGNTIFVIGLTNGDIDTEKWNSLDQKNLSFKVNNDGTTSGLFA